MAAAAASSHAAILWSALRNFLPAGARQHHVIPAQRQQIAMERVRLDVPLAASLAAANVIRVLGGQPPLTPLTGRAGYDPS